MELSQIDNNYYYFEDGKPSWLILSGYNIKSELGELSRRNISSISLNRYFCGYRINNLDFLKDYSFITKVMIVDSDFNCDGLYYLRNLQYLQIQTESRMDFSRFEHLNTLITNVRSSFCFPQCLRELHLWDFKLRSFDLTQINFPDELEHLEINKLNIRNLNGLPKKLKHLEIHLCRNLNSLEGIEVCQNSLEIINIENCPHISNYAQLHQCLNLIQLLIGHCNEMQDVYFVRELKKLEHISIFRTHIVSNDLKPLLPIKHVYFTDNASYNYHLLDFKRTSLDNRVDALSSN